MEKQCFLRPLDNRNTPVIYLDDNKPFIMGRGPLTAVKNTLCARSQVMLLPSFADNSVKVTQLGRNSCTINEKHLSQNSSETLHHDQKISLLPGMYTYILQFDPPPGKVVNMASDISDSEDETIEPIPKTRKTEVKMEVDEACWETHERDLLIYKSPNVLKRSRIAAYDLDGTLICPKSQRVFPLNAEDWKIAYTDVIETLKREEIAGYKIVIFTNQAGLNGLQMTRDFQIKIQKIVAKIGVPLEVYIAKKYNVKYRKPCTGMWEVMECRNKPMTINKKESFYCGDAAGRVEGVVKYKGVPIKKPTDHSQCDYFFAQNVGITFFTPEEHFLGIIDDREKHFTAFNPAKIPYDVPLCDESKQIIQTNQEMVLLVGSPASGKTQFSLSHMVPAGYIRVNLDELKSTEKCMKLAEQALKHGKKVVIDNTNGNVLSRQRYIQLAKKYRIPCRAFVLNVTISHAKHNNKFRELLGTNHALVGEGVINQYFKSLELPSVGEGFTDIVSINFWPTFEHRSLEKTYNLILCEK